MFFNDIIFENNKMSNLLSGKIILNEVYFGKTKELLEAEYQLDIFRNKYMTKYVLNTRVNSDPDLLKFDRMMEKIFGFGCFTMHIHNQSVINAFTMPIDYGLDYGNPYDNMIADKNGFKFKPEYDYCCFLGIYSGIIFNPAFTTGEVMATILHEIGHNFNSAINKSNGVLMSLYLAMAIYIDVLLNFSPQNLVDYIRCSNFYKKHVYKIGKELREKDRLPIQIYDVYNQVMDISDQLRTSISEVIDALSLGTLAIGLLCNIITIASFINPINIPIQAFVLKARYTDEESGDNFATMYGYGGEFSTGTAKMRTKEAKSSSVVMKAIDNIPIVSNIIHLNQASGILLMMLFDEHPNDVSRVKDQIDMLKYELKKEDIDPKMVKHIEADIELCEEALDLLIDCSQGIKDPYIAEKFYNRMAYYGNNTKRKLFGGKDKFEQYDKAFKLASRDKNRRR